MSDPEPCEASGFGAAIVGGIIVALIVLLLEALKVL